MAEKNRLILLILMICLFAACAEEGDDEANLPVPTASSTMALDGFTVEPARETVMVTMVPTAAATVTPTIPPTVEATPEPIGIAVDSALPSVVQTTVEMFVTDNQFLFRLVDAEADVAVGVNEGQPIIAQWVYAAVVPFPTVIDEITMVDLQAAWQAGEMVVDEETTAVFFCFLGSARGFG